MAKELTFKLILNADTNNLTQNLERSSDAAKKMFDRIKQESDRLRQSMQLSQEVSTLVQNFHNVTQELNRVSGASELSADNLRQMGEYGQQAIDRLQNELRDARLELNRLSATNATPQDIQNAQDQVQNLERGIHQTTIAVNAYQNAAHAASNTPPVPSQFQGEVSSLVTNLDSARRSIDATGNSSTHTRQQLEQMAQGAALDIQRYEQELNEARLELNRLSATNATPQDIEQARQRVRELETGIGQARTALDSLGNTSELSPLQQQISQLVTNLDGARNSIDQNGRSATHTRQQLERMAQNATQQLQQYEQQLESARLEVNRLSATNASPADIELARQRVRQLETGIEQATTSLRGFENASRTATNELAQGADRSDSAMNKVGRSVNVLQGAMAALGIGFGVHELVQIADNFQNISAQINLVSGDSKELHSSLEGVRQVATRTTSSLEATANLYARISQAGKDLGVTQQQALKITEAINQSIQISGGSAASAEAAITQLIQGLQSGVLRGEEFNSMMEQAPRLTTALSDSLKVTKGELRAMAGEGQLTSETVINALKEQSAVIAQEYTKIPTTIGGALTNVKTNFTMLIGELDSTNAASQGIVQTLLYLSENLDVLKTLFSDVAQVAAYFSDRLSETDPSTIEAVKNAIVTAYDALKTLISTIVEVGDAVNDVFFTGLDILFGWGGAVDGSSEKVNGLAVVINGLAVVMGALSDGVKAIGIGVNLLIGAFYDVAAATTYYIKMFTWGDVRAKLDKDYEVLTAQRDKYYAKAGEGALKFESDTKKALDNSVLNAEQANQKKIADNQKSLATIVTNEEAANGKLIENAQKKAALEVELAEARKTGNGEAVKAILTQITELDSFESKNAQASIQRDKEKLEAAKVLAESSMALNEGVLSDLTKEQLLRDGVIAKINDQGALEVSIYEDSAKLNADRFAKLEALSIEEKKLVQDRVVATQETGNVIVQNEAFIASEKVRLNDAANAALKSGDFEAYSQAKLGLDDVGNAQAQASQQRVEQHQQSNDAIQQMDASSFAMQKNHSDEQVRLSQIAAQAKKSGDFEAYSQAMLQIDQLTTSQTQADSLVSQSDLETLRKKEDVTKEKIKLAQQIIDSADGIITAEQKLHFEAQGLTVEYDKQGKAIVQQKATFSEAAKALGLDVSQALNLVSAGFSKTGESVSAVVVGLAEMGATGQQAANATYQAWQKWAEQAKNEAEIDAAKQQLISFEKQGVFSAKQVQIGMEYLDQVNGKIPENISEVEKAYKLLGITSSEEARKIADFQIRAFNVMKQSGTASTEQIKQGLINMADKIYASGDAAKIAWYEGQLAANGLATEIDGVGKTTVTSISQAEQSMNRLSNSVSNAGRSFRGMAQDARDAAEEIKSTTDARNDALTARSEAQAKERAESKSSKANGGSFASYSKADVLAELKGMGYDDKQAQKLAGSIMSAAFAKDKDTMQKNMGTGNATYLNAAFDKLLSQGQTASGGSIEVQKRLAALANGKGSVSVSTPANSEPASTRRLELVNGAQTATLSGSASDLDAMEKMLSEFEMLKKGT